MNATDIAPVEVPRLEPPPPDPTAERCHLLGPTALIVQALMGVFVIGSLVVKRHLEKRKRPWRVWALDVAKQLVGQGVIHMLNILVSAAGEASGADWTRPHVPRLPKHRRARSRTGGAGLPQRRSEHSRSFDLS